MSRPAFMIDCPNKCIDGKITLYSISYKGEQTKFQDICPKCGGSGRIVAHLQEKQISRAEWAYRIKMSRKQKGIMKEWLAFEKEVLYGKPENVQ